LFRAEAAAGQKEYQAAADALFQVPKSDERALPAYMKGAEILLSQANRPLEGVEVLERLVQMEPRLAEAHRHLIQFSALTLQRQQLIQRVRTAIEHRREPPEAYVYLFLIDTLRLANGVEMNSKWLEAYPDHEVFLVARALHMDEVRVAERGSAVSPADLKSTSIRERLLSDLFRRFPHNRELLAHQIERALVVGDTVRVVELLKAAPPSIDTDNRFWRYKGHVHETRYELDQAEVAYRKALELSPLDWSTMNRLAQVERIRKRYTEVQRLQQLVQQADTLRENVRKYPAAEKVGRDWLTDLAGFAEEAGDHFLAAALKARLGASGEQAGLLP
jgi:tetratricopeptide (TPR) repeat protein